MSEEIYLAGKVRKVSLPTIRGVPPTDAPMLKRLLLPQGELAQVYDADEGIRYLAWIELCPGVVRGNHYHEVKEELVYVIEGEVTLVVEDIASKSRAAVSLRAGDLVTIQVRVAHAVRAEKPGQAVEFPEPGSALPMCIGIR